MAEVKWIKLSTNMFEDEKIRLIENMPESDMLLIIWIKLLSQAGKTNANGYIYLNENIPYTDEMLATIFNRPLNIVRLALKTFEDFGMIEISHENFIAISNWEKHQNVEGLDKIRQQTRNRVAKHREKKQLEAGNDTCNVTVTHSNATDIDKELDIEIDKDINIENAFKNTKEEKNENKTTKVHEYFQKHIGKASQKIINEINVWTKVLNEELVIEAIKRSVACDKASWTYTRGILSKWVKSYVQSLDDVKSLDIQFASHRKEINNGKSSEPYNRISMSKAFSITGGKVGRIRKAR
ncbi:MAG: phage replisome organizer N-terminal domain-containing protein [Bacillota bacterium]|jgi:predicted phage replisome organizer|uniref:phage replisome organizer N-terminal domain-containing protein n=1 Tax=Fictibacillus TaxID=1329200 RepID=UPI0018CCAD3B|nr:MULTISPECIES: phage replisome organizer N-terminal domain-containing protein [unclassified Fictibacillus]MBH0157126.1 phage replisome organizer N-terminal domain-containing protein [Fictibacillus sp. 5RED26]MBH0159448.1 phage replisome organizer N-terminal domain-containing protein [Fictibacillus sp. 26RED30]MBH0163754.1 phage replisome organizer N-terminal domain-containing protein [Fictibacillus sp. 7GRE50]MBH0169621.1 phage replisome organizer N-terminal domain-containing protein [Fictiba